MQIVKAGARLLASRKRRLDHEHHTKDDNQCEDDDGKQARGSDRGARLQRTLLCWVRTMKDLVTITAESAPAGKRQVKESTKRALTNCGQTADKWLARPQRLMVSYRGDSIGAAACKQE